MSRIATLIRSMEQGLGREPSSLRESSQESGQDGTWSLLTTNTPGLNSDIRPPDSKFSERHRSSCQQGGGHAVKLSLPEFRTYISPAAQGARSPSCLASGATTSPTKSRRKNYTDS